MRSYIGHMVMAKDIVSDLFGYHINHFNRFPLSNSGN
jgi:hypothetical protein